MKLRICHLITQLELGGAQRNTLYTVNHLDRERFEPLLVCGPGGLLDGETQQRPWSTHFIKTLVRPVRPIKDGLTLIALYRLLRQTQPHILHTHSSKAGILGRIAGYFAGVPIIIHTFHGFGFTPGQHSLVRQFFIGAEKFCALFSTHLIFVSEANRSEATALHIGTNVPNSLIRSGIQFTPESGNPREGIERRTESQGLREKFAMGNAWVVAYIGNFKPQKNPMDLARTAKLVLEKDKDIHFLFVGDGELRAEVEAWVRDQGIGDRVHFHNWIQRRDDIAKILDESTDCFLLTSLWEGLPRALVEAAAASKPAVAYGVDGVNDIIHDGENGFLIPAGNVALAAEKILWLKSHPAEAARMGKAARAGVIGEFDINKMVKAQENLYVDLYDRVPLKEAYGLPTL